MSHEPGHRYTFTEKIQNGLGVTNRTMKKPVGAHLQGIEIKDINQFRSGLPVVGRNPRYEIADISTDNSGSISNQPWFEDVEAHFDGGISTDISGSVAHIKFPEGRIAQRISFRTHSADYGFGKEYYDSVPYYDLTNYDAQSYVNESGPIGMFPIVGSFPSYDSALQLNGIVEPFEIRRRILGQSLFLRDEGQPGAIWGHPPVDNPGFHYDVREVDGRANFFEDVSTKGLLSSGSLSSEDQAAALLEMEYVSDYNRPTFYFVERGNEDMMDYDAEIEGILMDMDPTLDEGLLPNKFVDQTTGWDSFSRDRVNSIAFRGLTRG